MLIGPFNVRGIGSRIKTSKIKEFISSNRLDFVVIRKTNLLTFMLLWCIFFGVIHYVSGFFPRYQE